MRNTLIYDALKRPYRHPAHLLWLQFNSAAPNLLAWKWQSDQCKLRCFIEIQYHAAEIPSQLGKKQPTMRSCDVQNLSKHLHAFQNTSWHSSLNDNNTSSVRHIHVYMREQNSLAGLSVHAALHEAGAARTYCCAGTALRCTQWFSLFWHNS